MLRMLVVTAALLVSARLPSASAASFSYQGYLTESGQPADGRFNIQFRLMDAAAGGAQVGPMLIVPDALVQDGVFMCSLDFGFNALAASQPRWLQVSVAPSGSQNYQPLEPRQRLQSVRGPSASSGRNRPRPHRRRPCWG